MRRPLLPLADALWFLAAAAAAVWLRLWGLHRQVLGGDELHLVRAVGRLPLPDILYTWETSDICQPLAGWVRWLLDSGTQVDDLTMRLPGVVAGVLLAVLVPLLLRQRLGRREAIVLAWLLALSPALVLYSRLVRGYSPAVLLASLALCAFWSWWERPRWRPAVAYAICAAGAAYFQLSTVTLVGAPLVFALGARARRTGAPRWIDLASLGAALAAAVAIWALPGRESLLALAGKHAPLDLPLASVAAVLHLQAGTGRTLVALAFWVAVVCGWAIWRRRDRQLAAFLVVVAGVHLLGLLILSPVSLGNPLVLNRYLLGLTPVLLLCVSACLAAARSPRAMAAAAMMVLAWLAATPFAEPAYQRSAFLGHPYYLAFDAFPAAPPATAVPELYALLATDVAEGTIIEFPASDTWRDQTMLPGYERVHRRELFLSTPANVAPGLRLRRNLPPTPAAFLDSGARWLVVHRRQSAEEAAWRGGSGIDSALRPYGMHLDAAGQRMSARLRAAWGTPAYTDEWIDSWDLERVRSARGR